jgi:hypothetical protein
VSILARFVVAALLGIALSASAQEGPPTLREYIQAVLNERSKQTEQRFRAMERLMESQRMAAKEATDKALESQQAINIGQNEFRAQLKDQASSLMPRKETETLVQGVRDSLDRQRIEQQAAVASLRDEIASLRESRSESSGASDQNRWMIGLIMGVIGFGIALFVRRPQMPPT